MSTSDHDIQHEHAGDDPTTAQQASSRRGLRAVSNRGVRVGDPASSSPMAPPTEDVLAAPGPSVAWLRPTDLSRLAGTQALGWGIGRGIDLQVALIRAAMRAPVRATVVVERRASHSHAVRPDAPAGPASPGGAAGAAGVDLS